MSECDVVVVGAGAAGLSCAAQLGRSGLRVLILEARDRIGGRLHTLALPDHGLVEAGAQVIHGERSLALEIAERAGLSVRPAAASERFFVRVGGRTRPMGGSGQDDQDIGPPWIIASRLLAAERPDRSAEQVLVELGVRGRSRTVVAEWLRQTWAADPAELSVSGLRNRQTDWTSGTGELVLDAGFGALAAYLAQGLDIRLSSPVTLVEWQRHRVRLHCPTDVVAASAAVLTVPPGVVDAGTIRFDPPLPPAKLDALARIGSGDGMTVVLDTAVEAPETRWILQADRPGLISRSDAGSTLVRFWVKGPATQAARRLGTNRAPQGWSELAGKLFGWLEHEKLGRLRIVDWGLDPYALGVFSYPRVGGSRAPAAWGSPLAATLYFAGEATADPVDAGLVQGAIRSGGRAADEILAAFVDD